MLIRKYSEEALRRVSFIQAAFEEQGKEGIDLLALDCVIAEAILAAQLDTSYIVEAEELLNRI